MSIGQYYGGARERDRVAVHRAAIDLDRAQTATAHVHAPRSEPMPPTRTGELFLLLGTEETP